MNTRQIVWHDIPLTIRGIDEPHAEWDEPIVKDIAKHYRFVDYVAHTYFVDIGAHVGAWTAYAKHMNRDAKVIAVEVNDDNHYLALHNIGGLPGVDLYHARAAYTAGDYVQAMWITNAGSNNVILRPDDEPLNRTLYEITVPDITIETMMQQCAFPRIDVLKLDCEGAEYDIINNMSEDLLKNTQHIIGEYHGGIDKFSAECLPRIEQHFEIRYLDKVKDWGLFHFERR